MSKTHGVSTKIQKGATKPKPCMRRMPVLEYMVYSVADADQIQAWCGGTLIGDKKRSIRIDRINLEQTAYPGDYIIKEIGEFLVMPAPVFHSNYATTIPAHFS